jgi:predicted aminopeptidase
LAPFSQAISEEKIFLNSSQSEKKNCPWWPNLLVERNEIEKLYKGPYIDAYYQVWFHLAMLFQRRRLKYEKVNERTTEAK